MRHGLPKANSANYRNVDRSVYIAVGLAGGTLGVLEAQMTQIPMGKITGKSQNPPPIFSNRDDKWPIFDLYRLHTTTYAACAANANTSDVAERTKLCIRYVFVLADLLICN